MEAAGLIRGSVPAEDFLKFKYQIDIDGNSNSWPGLYHKLLTGSPVLKVASPNGYRQWYYDRLKPWINYVPVQADMSDLAQKIEWLRTNDDQARAIGEAGLALARSLDYERELTLAHRTIRAAFRDLRDAPELEIEFGADREEDETLTQGWDEPENRCVWALDCHSLITLPRPILAVDYELTLDLEPNLHAPNVQAQRIVVAVNGVVVADAVLSQRESVLCEISRNIIENHSSLSILILHPDGFAPSAYLPIRDDRIKSVAIRALSIIRKVRARNGAVVNGETLMRTTETMTHSVASLTKHAEIMRSLYGRDVWAGQVASHTSEELVQGWNGIHPCFRRLLLEAPEKTFIDVGVWKGQSTIFVATLIRELGLDGCVISVDTFLGSVEHWACDGELFVRRVGMPNLYEIFCSNVLSHGVADLVVPMPQNATAAAQILRQRHILAGVIHIDASHEYEDVVRDLAEYWPLVVPGGFLVGDDYHPSWPGVVRAADEFAAQNLHSAADRSGEGTYFKRAADLPSLHKRLCRKYWCEERLYLTSVLENVEQDLRARSGLYALPI